MKNSTKSAFTLAEILIVLTIIGVMAVMTIPSLIQGTNSQQKITLFKKAFNALSNAYATEFAVKEKPTDNSDDSLKLVFKALENQLNVKYYIKANKTTTNQETGAVSYDLDGENKKPSGEKEYTKPTGLYENYWIVTEDGIGYRVNKGDSTTCLDKLDVNNLGENPSTPTDDTIDKACLYITVNVGGIKTASTACTDSDEVSDLKCDETNFYVTNQGITSGNPEHTITGKIISKDKD